MPAAAACALAGGEATLPACGSMPGISAATLLAAPDRKSEPSRYSCTTFSDGYWRTTTPVSGFSTWNSTKRDCGSYFKVGLRNLSSGVADAAWTRGAAASRFATPALTGCVPPRPGLAHSRPGRKAPLGPIDPWLDHDCVWRPAPGQWNLGAGLRRLVARFFGWRRLPLVPRNRTPTSSHREFGVPLQMDSGVYAPEPIAGIPSLTTNLPAPSSASDEGAGPFLASAASPAKIARVGFK